jgi:hypothetical protein
MCEKIIPQLRRLGGIAAIASLVASTPIFSASRRPIRSAVKGAVTLSAVPLWTMARWNSPSARGIDGGVATLMAPADCWKMAILPESPPKAPMFSCTHSSAAIWS